MLNEGSHRFIVEVSAKSAEDARKLLASVSNISVVRSLPPRNALPNLNKPLAIIGELVSYERYLKEQSVVEAGQALGWSNHTQTLIEKGRVERVKPKSMERIAEYLGFTPEQLMELAQYIAEERTKITELIGHDIRQLDTTETHRKAGRRTFFRAFQLEPNSPPLGGGDHFEFIDTRANATFRIEGFDWNNVVKGSFDSSIKTSTGYPVGLGMIHLPYYMGLPYNIYNLRKKSSSGDFEEFVTTAHAQTPDTF